MQVREEIILFAEDMERKLRLNDHKGLWGTLEDIAWFLDALKEEVRELEDAIAGEPAENVVLECADVANFALMIADMYREER